MSHCYYSIITYYCGNNGSGFIITHYCIRSYMIITYKYISYYTIITYHYQLSDLRLLSPIITVKMESSSVAPLAIITRSIVGNNGFIIAYY